MRLEKLKSLEKNSNDMLDYPRLLCCHFFQPTHSAGILAPSVHMILEQITTRFNGKEVYK